jgi:predicted metal-dependent enzyme (double-stranded beta helix superfamily)
MIIKHIITMSKENVVCVKEKVSKIDNLFKLFSEINKKFTETGTLSACEELFDRYNGDDWMKYISFSEESYKRNPIAGMVNENLEFILICWKPTQGSPIHDHPENGCLVKILKGSLREDIYVNHDDEGYKFLCSKNNKKGDISYMERMSIVHKISNPSDEKSAISLHIYSPPKFKYTICKIISKI